MAGVNVLFFSVIIEHNYACPSLCFVMGLIQGKNEYYPGI